jgi:hypothetical protein
MRIGGGANGVNGRAYVPVIFLRDVLGLPVQWVSPNVIIN